VKDRLCIELALMLEQTTAAGEPFENEAQDNRMNADFEQVCISLVERGWKILPKKGSYPINKQGPRYINLVDPRGNRKSIRVMESALWEKLRLVESTRSKKKTPAKKHNAKEEPASNKEPISESIRDNIPHIHAEIAAFTPPAELAPVKEAAPTSETELAPQPFQPAEIPELPPEVATLKVPESTTVEPVPVETKITEEIEKAPRSQEKFAISHPESQNPIFELGLDSLISQLRSETLSPPEIIQRVEDWTKNSKNMIGYMQKLDEPREVPIHVDSGENDALVKELQATLKETEDKLAALIRSAREI
jgi:hypothetical protein